MLKTMLKWFGIVLGTLFSVCRTHRALALENLALRQQLAVMKHRQPRPRSTDGDRLFWLVLSRLWGDWQSILHVVQPATVVRWHRQGFRYYWRWESRHRGRPKIDATLRNLIREISKANPLWGAPRIHGELLNLGIEVSQATVSKYIIRGRKPPPRHGRRSWIIMPRISSRWIF
ncbi:MAG: helix-turn-helix domain-containing protein [Gammaproteobacteria bacterium]|nr:helix-turn-helix domain-containing protein [Gammaproteobacteria bacterium]